MSPSQVSQEFLLGGLEKCFVAETLLYTMDIVYILHICICIESQCVAIHDFKTVSDNNGRKYIKHIFIVPVFLCWCVQFGGKLKKCRYIERERDLIL